MKNVLKSLGNIPISSSMIASLYPNIVNGNNKVERLERSQQIIRLKRGLYLVNPEISGLMVSTELIANHLCMPSYVSMETALRYYGLIPEAVYTVRSMTVRQSKKFSNHYGNFEFRAIAPESFHIGITNGVCDGAYFMIASPEKALCDLIAESRGVNLRYVKEAEEYLASYLRFDMEALGSFNLNILKEYIKSGKKAKSIQTIIKLIDQ